MTRNRPFRAGEHTRERRRGFDSGIRREKRRPPAAHRDQAKARKRVSGDVAERDLGRKETGLTRIRRGRGLGGRAERPGEASAARPRGAEEEEEPREGGGELGKAVSLVATVAVAPGGFVSRCCGRACRNFFLRGACVPKCLFELGFGRFSGSRVRGSKFQRPKPAGPILVSGDLSNLGEQLLFENPKKNTWVNH